jgi:hypothetical protein
VNAEVATQSFPVFYNESYGGFSFSTKAIEEYNKRLSAESITIDVLSWTEHLQGRSGDGADMYDLGTKTNGKICKDSRRGGADQDQKSLFD